MDKFKETSDVIEKLNLFFEKKITNYKFIKNVCTHFDKLKGENLSSADLKFLRYLANIVGIPHYYDMLSKFNDLKEKDYKNYDLNTFSALLYESSLHTDKYNKIHRYQKDILNQYKKDKQNRFFLSATTSFGKTFLIYEIIKKMKYKNIVLIFPTIALLSENYERIMTDDNYQYFHDNFSIHTLSEVDEENFGENNIFIYTPERYLSFIDKNSEMDIDFVFVDEIYKIDNEYIIDNISKENERDTAYRVALFHILSNTKDILLVGPYIEFPDSNDNSINQSFNIFLKENSFEIINYNKFDIVNKSYHIINGSRQFECDDLIIDLSGFSKKNKGEKLAKIVDDIRTINENAIFYTRGAGTAEKVAKSIIENSLNSNEISQNLEELIIHLENRFNLNDWVLIRSLKNKIGIHHGLVPKYIQKEIINLFNNGEIDLLISTTTITEGVNTSAKNLIIDSTKKGNKDLKTFDAKNIAGRAGRFLHHYSGRVLILKKEFEEVLNGTDNEIKHKNYDEHSPKDEIDLFITNEEYLNDDNKSQRKKIDEEQEKRGIPNEIMQMYKVISYSDKIEVYDRLIKLSNRYPEQYREMQQYINKLGGLLYIDYRGFQIISHIFKPIVTNDNLKQLMEREINNQYGKSSLLTNLLYFYFKDGFMGSVKYKIEKQNKSTDDAMKESANFVFNALKYQLVKYLGVFNIMYKFLESQKKEVSFYDIHGIERLLMKLEYNAVSEEGRLASDYGVPSKIIEYYDNEENRDTIRKQFDTYEEEKFKKIEAILES